MMSIPAAKGFEYGEGFAAAEMKGSEHNDALKMKNGKISFATNHAGGILGGISNCDDIYFNVAFKPVSSISKNQKTINNKVIEKTLSKDSSSSRRVRQPDRIVKIISTCSGTFTG